MQSLSALVGMWVMPTHTGTEALALILRWFHFIAGITWVGLLYFFNLVNVPFMKQVDASMKPKIFQYMTMPALQIFRWSALLTVFFGLWYWGQILVAPDAAREGKSAAATIGLFLLVWIVASAILYFVISKSPSGYLLGAVVLIVVIAASWAFLKYTPVGQDDNHVLSIGVGGGMGIIMLFNVWGIIWRNNKKIIRGTLAGTLPSNAPTLARQVFLASRTNLFLSVPLLFFMATASHYVIFGR
ncbi:MAG TPA: urate hydroxylase PuuD [Terriglobales bacterium]|nr:urate hydroxylase PuuD [Terriglobales bacterium]